MSINIPEPLDPVVQLKEKFPDVVQDVDIFRDEVTIVIAPDNLADIMRYLRDTPGLIYNYLSDISAVDYYPDVYSRPGRFGMAYHLYSLLYNRRLRIKAYVDEDEPEVPTITEIWQGANWLEREIMDMMGITFVDHPDQRRLLMPKDWDGHPHRRDYPLGYETVQFSFNAKEITKHKPKAES
jgi:NADH-quinone oxidoreductase subunit C